MEFEDGYVNYSFGDDSSISSMFDWVTNNYGYANILMSIFIAFWIKVFFRKHGFNFFEILILLCFVIGIGMLLFSFFGMLDSLTNLKIVDKGYLLGILYISWGIGQFFQKRKIVSFLKGFFSYMLGVFSFGLIIIVLGAALDWINHWTLLYKKVSLRWKWISG